MPKKRNEREGCCYKYAFLHILRQGTLIHAEVCSFALNRRIDHAFVETETGFIYEPVSNRYFIKGWLYEQFEVVEKARYSAEEATRNAVKYKNYGPRHNTKGGGYMGGGYMGGGYMGGGYMGGGYMGGGYMV